MSCKLCCLSALKFFGAVQTFSRKMTFRISNRFFNKMRPNLGCWSSQLRGKQIILSIYNRFRTIVWNFRFDFVYWRLKKFFKKENLLFQLHNNCFFLILFQLIHFPLFVIFSPFHHIFLFSSLFVNLSHFTISPNVTKLTTIWRNNFPLTKTFRQVSLIRCKVECNLIGSQYKIKHF